VKSDVDFTSLSLSKTDVVWAGTSEGQVYTAKLKQLINSGDIQLSKEASLTKGTVIRELVVGLRGHVWILSDLYLKEYNPITHISRLMNHSASNINMKKLCTINMESDSISLGGIGAFCLIPASEQLNEPGVALRPRISSAFIDDIECFVQEGDHLYIPRTAKEVRLFVTTFNYLHAASIQLAYRLDEDDDWTELSVGENCIVLTDLPDGDNDLQLRATDKYGNWGEPMHCVYRHKTAPWYAAWWLMVLILGALLVLGYCVWKKRQWLIGLVKPSAKPTKPEEQPAKLEEETAKPEEEPAKPEEEPAKTEEEPAATPIPVISSPSDEPTEETTQPADTPPVTKPKRKRKAKAAPAPEPETEPISESKSESESESQPTSELKPESNLDSKSEEQHKELSFEEKLEKALQRNIGDVDFGVEELSAALFMSRMNLYRKMQATLGVKPADYLRNKRLDLAERLLRETDEAITAISEQTGFKNRRSFSMAFKEKYGISPTEFRENLRKTNSKD
jgi:AraC-like DNA-binding protein